jgi:hypothetical protein
LQLYWNRRIGDVGLAVDVFVVAIVVGIGVVGTGVVGIVVVGATVVGAIEVGAIVVGTSVVGPMFPGAIVLYGAMEVEVELAPVFLERCCSYHSCIKIFDTEITIMLGFATT